MAGAAPACGQARGLATRPGAAVARAGAAWRRTWITVAIITVIGSLGSSLNTTFTWVQTALK